MSNPDLDQVQGNILTAFNTDYQTYLGFNLPAGADLVPVRSWIADLANVVTVHSQVKSERQAMKDGTNANPWVFAAFGHDLLRRLRRDVTFFSRPFRFGYANRRVFLGDHSDPSDWAFGANDTSRLDVLILLADNDSTRLHSVVETFQTGAEQVGLRPFWMECGVRLPGDKEVFGFKDGISQPQVQLGDGAILQPSETLKSGQFVMGSPNENGDLPSDLLTGDKQFSDGGSFLQIRRLQQDREAFGSLPVPEGRPIGATVATPVRRICPAHRPPVAADNCNRRDASRPLKPSRSNRANRSRSSFGNGAGMM